MFGFFENKHKKTLRVILKQIQEQLDLLDKDYSKKRKDVDKLLKVCNSIQGVVNAGNAMYNGDFDIISVVAQNAKGNMRWKK